MTDTALKAYVVREDWEGGCSIQFAAHAATARSNGANDLGLSFEEVESCRRAPEFDQYAPGPVPLRATLAAGWWHYCNGCQTKISDDGRDYDDIEDREDEFEPVEDAKGNPYCSPTCMMTDWADRREQKAREHAAVEAALTRWPMALSASAGRYSKNSSAECEYRAVIRLPGIQHTVTWTPGAATVDVSQSDVEEFKRLYGVKS